MLLIAQTELVFWDYHPTVPPALLHPVTDSLAAIRDLVGRETLLGVDGGGIPANVNLVYGLRGPGGISGLGVARYDRLYAQLMGVGSYVEWESKPSGQRALQLLGVRYVSTVLPYPWLKGPPAETGFVDGASASGADLGPAMKLSAGALHSDAGLAAVSVAGLEGLANRGCSVTLELLPAASETVRDRSALGCDRIEAGVPPVFPPRRGRPDRAR